jgi:hypothetical protein
MDFPGGCHPSTSNPGRPRRLHSKVPECGSATSRVRERQSQGQNVDQLKLAAVQCQPLVAQWENPNSTTQRRRPPDFPTNAVTHLTLIQPPSPEVVTILLHLPLRSTMRRRSPGSSRKNVAPFESGVSRTTIREPASTNLPFDDFFDLAGFSKPPRTVMDATPTLALRPSI